MCGNYQHDERGWHVDEKGNPLPEGAPEPVEAPVNVTEEVSVEVTEEVPA